MLAHLSEIGWRWLCIPCGEQGAGHAPARCDECGNTDIWYETNARCDDPRPMSLIFEDVLIQMFGRTLH